jgi:hypothetical protein
MTRGSRLASQTTMANGIFTCPRAFEGTMAQIVRLCGILLTLTALKDRPFHSPQFVAARRAFHQTSW